MKKIFFAFTLFAAFGCAEEELFVSEQVNNQDTQAVKTTVLAGPTLLSPSINTIMDNGCESRENPIIWDFSWSEVEGAETYQLYVKGSNAIYAAINCDNITTVTYHHQCDGCYIVPNNYNSWTWKVRAKVNDEWTSWTSSTFDVEELNTDCQVDTGV